MKTLSIDEDDRLAVLRQYNFFDTAPEPAFDELAHLAAQFCAAPISAITFINEKGQWFKSRLGFDAPVGFDIFEDPRAISFWTHTILGTDLLLVPDTTADERFAENPLVTAEPHLRFYAGVPLITPEGHAIGTLCVLDTVPRQLDQFQHDALRKLGDQVVSLLEARRDTDQLKTSEIRYRRLFEAARDGILILDALTCKITDANPFMVELLGYPREELLGKELFEIGLLGDSKASQEMYRELQESGYIRYDGLPLQTKWGKRREVEFVSNTYAENGQQVIQCNIRDITERKRTEAASARLAAIVESSDDAIISKTLEGVITSWNAGAQKLYGYSAEEAIGRSVSFLAPSSLPCEMPQLLEKIKRGELVQHYETVRVHKDGSRVDISLSISPLRDAKGNIIGASSIKRDITQRKQGEDALRESEQRYRSLFDNSIEGIYQALPDGRYKAVNPALAYMLGYNSPSEMITDVNDAAHQLYVDQTRPDLLIRRLEQHGEVSSFESQVYRKNGTTLCVSENVRAVRDSEGAVCYYQGMVKDISERVQVQRSPNILHTLVVIGTAALMVGWFFSHLQGAMVPHIGDFWSERIENVADALIFTALGYMALRKQATLHRLSFVEIGDRKQAEEALRRQQSELRVLFDLMPAMIWFKDTDNGILRVNKQVAKAAGKSVEEIEGRSSHEIYPQEAAQFYADDLKVIRSGKPKLAYVAMMQDREGEKRWIQTDKVPVCDKDGKVVGIVVMAQDITERKQAEEVLQRAHGELEERVEERTAALAQANVALHAKEAEQQRVLDTLLLSEERFRLLVESVHDYAILMLDASGHVMTWNAGAEHLKGYLAEEIIGRHHSCFYTEEDREANKPEQELLTATSEGYFDDEGWRVRKDGSRFWATVVITPLFDDAGGLRGFAKITRDITERKNIEAALHEAKAQADTANLAKSEFLSRMSHELRTPLNAILGFGQILELRTSNPEAQESVQHILKGGRHLLDLINEVLDIARVEAGHFELSLESIDLAEVIPEVCALLHPLATQRQIRLDEKTCKVGQHFIQADHQRLKQVLINLLSNAIKYNRKGGEVEVLCSSKPNGCAAIEVRDTGPGISSQDLPKLFTPFERLGAGATTVEGTGLGLALSQRLVKAMSGTLSAESVLGRGTTFTLEFPQATSPMGQLADLPEATCHLVTNKEAEHSYIVLCIEDNPSNLRLLEVIFRGRPEITLLTAIQGSVGLDLAEQHRPDLILLDLNLPDIHGAEVLAHLQQSALTRDIPVVVVSADATPNQIKRLLAAGASDYLTKPLNVSLLLRTVDKLLSKDEEVG